MVILLLGSSSVMQEFNCKRDALVINLTAQTGTPQFDWSEEGLVVGASTTECRWRR